MNEKHWIVGHCNEFAEEFQLFPSALQDELVKHQLVLEQFGPEMGRPLVDTIRGSKLANLKELRFTWDGQSYRFLFAFDPYRNAIILVGGCKANDKKFYQKLIP
ncbi:MAG: type II toxin-antitoxin system RelE/ParE family toxin [Desulfovibrionaceae bacterium]|nr:type II toxin-antitoxin system RelE/ParE family toxin [Desulfovibrionaceae bacterium]